MAATSMKDIRLRIKSVTSTKQITKAMQLVASSKLRHARERMEMSRPYLEIARDTIADIAKHNLQGAGDMLTGRADIRKRCVIVVAGDRGLAGSYNANVFRLYRDTDDGMPACILPIGRRASENFASKGYEILPEAPERAEGLELVQCREIAVKLIERYNAGEFDEIVLYYTGFGSILSQTAKMQKLLPANEIESGKQTREMLFEPEPQTLLQIVMPDYLAGMIYAAVCDSVASEQAARRVAMDSATKNADKMIEDLNLRYNRARQASITQELTEIVAGAENDNEEN